MRAVLQADFGQRVHRAVVAIIRRNTLINQGQFDILQGGGPGQQVEALKDEAEKMPPQ